MTVAQLPPPVCAEFYVRFLPRKAVRKISIVFDIFRLARQNLFVCAGRELLAELRRKFELCNNVPTRVTIVTSIVFEQDETRNFEGKHTAMAGAAPSVDTAVTPMPAMAVESNSTNNTVLVETIAEDRLVSSWPDYPCLYNIRSTSFTLAIQKQN